MIERNIMFDENGEANESIFDTKEEQTKAGLREFECPRCHSDTYGYFEPFMARFAIERWCSSCGYSTWKDRETERKAHKLMTVEEKEEE